MNMRIFVKAVSRNRNRCPLIRASLSCLTAEREKERVREKRNGKRERERERDYDIDKQKYRKRYRPFYKQMFLITYPNETQS